MAQQPPPPNVPGAQGIVVAPLAVAQPGQQPQIMPQPAGVGQGMEEHAQAIEEATEAEIKTLESEIANLEAKMDIPKGG